MTKIPDRLFGKPIKGSLERVLREPEVKVEIPITPNINIPSLDKFIYVPSISLYVAKERTHFNKDWNESHELLKLEDSFMLNPYYFAEFLKYLKQNPNPENLAIFNEITEVRSPWRAEHLDAKFSEKDKKILIEYHTLKNGSLQEVTELLDALTLMQDKTPGIDLEYWLNNKTSQGLPTKNTPNGDLYYWHPKENCVARFGAYLDRAYLDCFGYPGYSVAWLGIRRAKIRP